MSVFREQFKKFDTFTEDFCVLILAEFDEFWNVSEFDYLSLHLFERTNLHLST